MFCYITSYVCYVIEHFMFMLCFITCYVMLYNMLCYINMLGYNMLCLCYVI